MRTGYNAHQCRRRSMRIHADVSANGALYSVCSSHVTEKANPGGVVRNSLNSYEWFRARKQRLEKKNSYEASTER